MDTRSCVSVRRLGVFYTFFLRESLVPRSRDFTVWRLQRCAACRFDHGVLAVGHVTVCSQRRADRQWMMASLPLVTAACVLTATKLTMAGDYGTRSTRARGVVLPQHTPNVDLERRIRQIWPHHWSQHSHGVGTPLTLRPYTFVVHTAVMEIHSSMSCEFSVTVSFDVDPRGVLARPCVQLPRQHRVWPQRWADVKRFRLCVHGDKSLSGTQPQSTEWWTFPLCNRAFYPQCVSVSCGMARVVEITEHEMPGLLACRVELGPSRPFKSVNTNGFSCTETEPCQVQRTPTTQSSVASCRWTNFPIFLDATKWKRKTLQECQ